MITWSGLGMNYGHQATYDSSVVEADLTYLASVGVKRVRIAFPTYGGGGSTANCQDMVARAIAHGMYTAWGVATGVGVGALTATIWAAYKSYLTGTLIPWAAASGLSELCLGNECDFEADGITLLASTVRSDIRALAATAKASFSGAVSYSTAANATLLSAWATEGIGSLDLLGWNSYDTLQNFTSRAATIVSNFGSKGYVSEFGCIANGFSDYNDESLWYTDVINRVTALSNAGVSAGYFFCYRDGGFGLTPNTFAVQLSPSGNRTALYAVKNVVAPVYGRF